MFSQLQPRLFIDIKSSIFNMASMTLRPARTALRCLSKPQLRTYSGPASPADPAVSPFAPRHFLSIADLTPAELVTLVKSAKTHKNDIKKGLVPKKVQESLNGKTVAMMFNKRSTRTRVSTEAAVVNMGGHPMFLGKDDIQLGVNESLYDTSVVISSMTSCMVVRAGEHSEVADLAKHSSVPVINALTNDYHPLQTIADFLTIHEAFPSTSSVKSTLSNPSLGLEGLKIAWIGDSNNVLFDLAIASVKLGVDISVASPKGFTIPPRMKEIILASAKGVSNPGKLTETGVPEEAIKDADILVTDTWVSMGQEEEYKKRLEAFAGYQITNDLAKRGGAKAGWKFMHCLPRHPEEVADEVFYSPRSLVFPEAENRLYAAIAAIEAFVVNKGKIVEIIALLSFLSKPTVFLGQLIVARLSRDGYCETTVSWHLQEMSQHITSMLNPSNVRPPSLSDAVPSYDDHTLDERVGPASSRPVNQATSETPKESRPLSSNNPYRQLLEPSPPVEPFPDFSTSPQSAAQASNQTPPTPPTASWPTSLPPQQTPAELAALQATAQAAQKAPEFLSLDRDLIFPPPPSQALYSLAFALSPNSVSNTVRRSVPAVIRADGSQRSEVTDKDLYTIRRDPISNSCFTIEGKRRSTFPGTLTLRYHANIIKGPYWDCTVEKTGELLMRGKGEEWIDGLGRTVGREPGGICLRRKKRKAMEKDYEKRLQGQNVDWKPPVLELVGEGRKAGGDDPSEEAKARIRDLLVTCWVAKCWDSEKVASLPEQSTLEGPAWKRRSEAVRGGGIFF
ncbi:hypothetical protein V495_00773 [Pseudogymnoascus sp. VKM F-4514 (FW-929)]|nr:hypothetical protein V495_00773 [Pseudogymnoascus sp. VKM F-4514 (FW-929)]